MNTHLQRYVAKVRLHHIETIYRALHLALHPEPIYLVGRLVNEAFLYRKRKHGLIIKVSLRRIAASSPYSGISKKVLHFSYQRWRCVNSCRADLSKGSKGRMVKQAAE